MFKKEKQSVQTVFKEAQILNLMDINFKSTLVIMLKN